jgi:acyl carrier protein phosphodiesterase
MNYLAHFYLSGNDTGLLLGNFMADSVKGNKYLAYAPEIQKGIRMHRFIDQYTDTHEITEQTKARLRPEFHHYAPVIQDVFYDHFLAANWKDFHPKPLNEFAREVYARLEEHNTLYPEKTQIGLKYMKMHDWLTSYASMEGIHAALTGMSRRTPYVSHMEVASLALARDYAAYYEEFKAFFPQLETACAEFLRTYTP